MCGAVPISFMLQWHDGNTSCEYGVRHREIPVEYHKSRALYFSKINIFRPVAQTGFKVLLHLPL